MFSFSSECHFFTVEKKKLFLHMLKFKIWTIGQVIKLQKNINFPEIPSTSQMKKKKF